MSDDLIGKQLGQYQITALLGKGGMSTVYRATQPSMDRVVAIKVLPREFLHDATFLERFKREARTIARLEHLHILPVYDVGEADGVPYIVMRYLTGGTLSDLIAAGLPDYATIARIVGQIADALDHAHARGIIHRDMKPSNVLLDKDQNAYLADFGIARAVQHEADLTGSRIIGTPSYVAPEMVRKGETITGSVDIYGLGIISYQMFAGEPPYQDDDPMAVLMAHVLEPVPSIRDFDPNIPAAIDRALKRCLAKTPQERYRTAREYADALALAVAGSKSPPTPRPAPAPAPVAAGGSDTPPSGTHRRPDLVYAAPDVAAARPRRRQFRGVVWLVVLAVMLATALGVAAVAYSITDGDPASLLGLLTPIPTRSLRPSATPASGEGTGPTSAPDDPTPTAVPVSLPPPSGGDRLAFASNRDGDWEIYLLDIDGSNLRQITDNADSDFDPAWSPDGRQIAFAHRAFADGQFGDAEIMLMNADGSNIRQLTDNEADDTDPTWSPDGGWLAFSSNRDGDAEIYKMRIDGSNVTQLTDNEGTHDFSPRWSPEGRRVGYHARVGNNNASSEIYIVDASGAPPYQATENGGFDAWMSWSPDGQRIAYSSGLDLPDDQRAIVVLNLQTTVTVTLTVDAIHDDDPAWSPDGGRIAFDSDRDGDRWFDLYVLDVATGLLRQLTFDDADDVTPAWQPRGG